MHSCSGGLAWASFRAREKRQSLFWGIRSCRQRLLVECVWVSKTVQLQVQGWKMFESGPSQEVHDLLVPLLEDKFTTPNRLAACEANSPWAWKLFFRQRLLCLCHKTGSYHFLGKMEVAV